MSPLWLTAFGLLAALLLFLGGYTFVRGAQWELPLTLGFAAPGLLLAIAVALDVVGATG